jgi:hypothetical protein
MKKVFLSIFGIVAIAAGFAQQGNNQISAAAEVAIPMGDAGEQTKSDLV